MKKFIEIVRWYLANARPDETKQQLYIQVNNELLIEIDYEWKAYHAKLEHEALLRGEISQILTIDEDGRYVLV